MPRETDADSSTSFCLAGGQYLARPIQSATVMERATESPSLLTYFRLEKNQTINTSILQTWRTTYLDPDDVFEPEFLQHIIFGGVRSENVNIENDTSKLFNDWQTIQVHFESDVDISNGPYYLENGLLHSVWKVYQDRQLAFVQAIWPSQSNPRAFVKINATGNDYRSHGIAAPARSYSQRFQLPSDHSDKYPHNPLKGIRVVVKDNYHIRGTRTSLGNRAYLETYPIQEGTTDVVSRLIEAGVHIVGKAHLSSFAMMEHPMQSVDYQAPFNPRGDGYLITGGSSGGTAAAVAAYDWLDIAICSDSELPYASTTYFEAQLTELSKQREVLESQLFQTGVFGFRPSTQSISTNGLTMAWPAMDTPGWLGRNLEIFPHLVKALRRSEPKPQQSKESLCEVLYVDDFIPKDHQNQVDMMKHFITDISKVIGCTYRKISLQDEWRVSAPIEEKDLQKYLYNTTRHGWYYSAYHSFDKFRKDYQNLHGHGPFVTEVVRWYWALGKDVTLEQHEEMMNRFSVFKDWFIDRYISDESKANIVALHIDTVQAKYRDVYPGNNSPEVPGLRATYLSAILHAPELAIPISQIPYQSRITRTEEQLPMVVSLMGAPGTDLELLQWAIKALHKSGRLIQVNTGRTIFKQDSPPRKKL
ncbi:amidase signature domain-containing protein [Xylogone sp. PMI_703]|nr:amidase signature domain-containing protein [Xylogone sp. PMI_703]